VLFAWLMLGELPTGIQLGGGGLIMLGIVLVRIDEMLPAGAAPDAAFDAPAETAIETVPMSSRAR
jgi:hypothetical protein